MSFFAEGTSSGLPFEKKIDYRTSINPAGPVGSVAQSVERWTPCGGSTRPGFKSPGFEA